ncbi:J domain-containing protein [Legionella clemsonensis]|uniref:Chaperone protein DnaJ n=1 Tax=Legionella clemsonensis TaxID=1867846 RepID=A0A222P009_9GAMM|nr:J domain-containing protein [Legionella clemsonensis]ASQ45169.1 chaperone protein DnaJ [Legionella clemsonensis]
MPSYYEVLGLDPKNKQTITQADIKKAYTKKLLDIHPDKHPELPPEKLDELNQKFQQVRLAYLVLGNAQTRKEYDEEKNISYNYLSKEEDEDYQSFLRELKKDPIINSFFSRIDDHILWFNTELNKIIHEEYLKLSGFWGVRSTCHAFMSVYLNPYYWVYGALSESLKLNEKFKYYAVDNFYRKYSLCDALICSALAAFIINVPLGFFCAFPPALLAAVMLLTVVASALLTFHLAQACCTNEKKHLVTIRETKYSFFAPAERIELCGATNYQEASSARYIEKNELSLFQSNRGIAYNRIYQLRGLELPDEHVEKSGMEVIAI